MNCIHCHKPIALVPSAEERARKDVTGRPASFYRSLFREHTACTLAKRENDMLALLQAERENAPTPMRWTIPTLSSARVHPQQGAHPCSTS